MYMTISNEKSIQREKDTTDTTKTERRQSTYKINPLILDRWSPRYYYTVGQFARCHMGLCNRKPRSNNWHTDVHDKIYITIDMIYIYV
jgi:hypothetical protein